MQNVSCIRPIFIKSRGKLDTQTQCDLGTLQLSVDYLYGLLYITHDMANYPASISPLSYVVKCYDSENQAIDVSQERQYRVLVHGAAVGLDSFGCCS